MSQELAIANLCGSFYVAPVAVADELFDGDVRESSDSAGGDVRFEGTDLADAVVSVPEEDEGVPSLSVSPLHTRIDMSSDCSATDDELIYFGSLQHVENIAGPQLGEWLEVPLSVSPRLDRRFGFHLCLR
jgi:hypothetical protein